MSFLRKNHLIGTLILLSLCGCGGGGSDINTEKVEEETVVISAKNFVGAVHKGPLVIGSTVTVNLLSSDAVNTDSTINTNTEDDLGRFSFSLNKEQTLLELSGSGYYRNEITGELSQGTITLRSVTEISEEENQIVYVNILTHITSQRIRNLIKDEGLKFDDARNQAEIEFLIAFSVVVPNTAENDFISLSIFDDGVSSGSSYLLAVSSILYQYALNQSNSNSTATDAELTLFVNKLEGDFGENGIIDDTIILESLRATIPEIDPVIVSNNIDDWINGITGYKKVDINEYLDTDLDGIFNIIDNDDDNDGIEDDLDTAQYQKSFIVVNQALELNEDQIAEVNIETNNPLDTEIQVEVVSLASNGLVSGIYPNLTYTPNTNFNGSDAFSYKLTQGDILSEIAIVNMSVNEVNDAPIISGIPVVKFMAHNTYSFSPSIFDVENDTLILSIENLPSWASFNVQTGEISGFPTNDNIGLYKNILLRVSDGNLITDFPSFDIDVQINPYELGFIIENQNLEVTEDSSVSVDISSNNPLNSNIEVTITQNPVHGIVQGEYPELTYIPNENFNGVDTIKYQLSQDVIISGEVTISLNVIPSNDEPIISGLPDAEVTAYTRYSFTPSVSDIDGDILEFLINNKPNWLNFSTTTGHLSGTPSNDDAGPYSDIVVSVSDGLTEISLTSFTILVESSPWVPQKNMPKANYVHASAQADGVIYIFGGYDSVNGGLSNDVFAFYPDTDSWEVKSPMPIAANGVAAHHVDGKIYVFGGYNLGSLDQLHIYSPNTDTWVAGTPMIKPRSNFVSCVVDGKIYVIGGGMVEVYDPLSGDWTIKSSAPVDKKESSASNLGGKIYYMGGYGPTNKDVHIYDPITNLWSTGTPFNNERFGLSTEVVDGILYSFGGFDSVNGLEETVEAYDPALATWQLKTKMRIPRARFSSTVVNGKIFLFGGSNNSTSIDSVEMYDPNID